MPTHNRLSVLIEVDETPLEEFRVTSNDVNPPRRRVECMIPSEADKNFSIRILDESERVNSLDHAYGRMTLFLDGVQCLDQLFSRTRTFRDVPVSFSTSRLLKFASIQIAELDGPTHKETISHELSTIRLEICYVRKMSVVPPVSYTSAPKVDKGPLSEKSKKAGGNCGGLGATKQRIPDTAAWEVVVLPHPPSTTFVFTHAPRAWLQAKDIIPRDVPPIVDEAFGIASPVNKKRKRSESRTLIQDEEEVQFLTNEEADLFRQLKLKIKTERKKVKSEPCKPSLTLHRNSQKTVIDLSED